MAYTGRSAAFNRIYFVYQNTNSSITATTAETILLNSSIQSNSLLANDRLMIDAQMFCVGTAGAKTWRVYLNTTSNSLSGAVQIATLTQTITNLTAAIRRVLVNKNSQSVNEVFPVGTTAVSDIVQAAAAQTTTNIDFSTQQYLIMSCQLSNSGDTGVLSNIQVFLDKAI